MDGPRFSAFHPLGSRAQLEFDILCLAEAYKWDPITVTQMPSSQRHRYVKMKEQIVQERNAKASNQTTTPQPTLKTGISPAPAAERSFGINYSE